MSFKASSFDLIKDLPSEKNVIEAALLAKMSISDTKISFHLKAKWREANDAFKHPVLIESHNLDPNYFSILAGSYFFNFFQFLLVSEICDFGAKIYLPKY